MDTFLLMGKEPYLYEVDDIQGGLYMLDHRLEGCISFALTEEVDLKRGRAVLEWQTENGRHTIELPAPVYCELSAHKGSLVMGIFVRPYIKEYGKKYQLVLSGFCRPDGSGISERRLSIKSAEKLRPEEEWSQEELVALKAAREGMVLCKNEKQVLPFSPGEKVALFGQDLTCFRLGAVGAGKINPRFSITLLDGILEYTDWRVNEASIRWYQNEREEAPDQETLRQWREESTTALIVISRSTGENYDNRAVPGEYYLTESEERMLAQVSEVFEKTVVLLNTGYTMDVRWAEKYEIAALLWCGLPGMAGGRAVVEILSGQVNPSGKLPSTWALDYYDYPSSWNFYQGIDGKAALDTDCGVFLNTVYEEDIYVGYRYFDTFSRPVAYRFGYGLSYTTFEEQYTISKEETAKIPVCHIYVIVKNTGERSGKQSVQLYAEIPDGDLEQPVRRLVDFAKTKELAPEEEEKLELTITAHQISSYSEEKEAWLIEAGTIRFFATDGVKRETEVGLLEIEQETIVFQTENRLPCPALIQTLSKKGQKRTEKTTLQPFIKSGIVEHAEHVMPYVEPVFYPEENPLVKETAQTGNKEQTVFGSQSRLLFSEVEKHPEKLIDFVRQLSDYELCRISVCAKDGWGMEGTGEAGRLYQIPGYGLPEYVVADGNNGVNLRQPNIGMPTSVLVSASFNWELAEEVGAAVAREAKKLGIRMILAPAANLHRDPLNGRAAEYFSEDPYLAGTMAGYHSKGLEEEGVSSSVKHFLANNCESSRKRNQSLMTERAARELYLKVFETALRIHQPDCIMTSYNAVNGCYPCENPQLLQGILRKEMGFEGYFVTDWNSYDTADIVKSVAAGTSWLTPGSEDDRFVEPLVAGVAEGKIERARLEKNVWYFLRTMLKK